MIIKARDILNIVDSKTYNINISNIDFNNNYFVKSINDINGFIEFYYDESDSLFMHYDLECSIVCPGSNTPCDVCFNEHYIDDEKISFDENDDAFYIEDACDIAEIVKSIILPLIPLKSESLNDSLHIEGDGWTITSEKEYAKIQKNKEDPRLSILKNYKEDK